MFSLHSPSPCFPFSQVQPCDWFIVSSYIKIEMKYIHVLPLVCFSDCFLICLPTLRHRNKRLLHGGSAQHRPGGRRCRPHVCQHGVGSVWGQRRARWLLHTVRSHGGRLFQQPGKTEVPDEQAVCVCSAHYVKTYECTVQTQREGTDRDA